MANLPPLPRRDWIGATLAAVLGGGVFGYIFLCSVWKLAALHGSAVKHFKYFGQNLINSAIPHFYVQESGLWKHYLSHSQDSFVILSFLWLSLIAAAYVAGEIFYHKSKPMSPEIHKIGRRLDTKSVIKESRPANQKQVGFWLHEVFFSQKKIRTHIFLLAASGGGKTQALWHIFSQLLPQKFKILMVDGAKGDWSQFLRKKFPVCAPWHSGLVWDIGRDCRTRNHAASLAARLIPDAGSGDAIWVNASRAIFIASACKLIAEKAEKWGWGELYNEISKGIPQLYECADRYYPPARRLLADAESKTTGSVILNLDSYTAMLYELSEAWKGAREGQKFSFLDWFYEPVGGDRKTNPSVVILQSHGAFKNLSQAYLSAIINLLNDTTISPEVDDSKMRKSLIQIDELAQCGKLDVAGIIEVGRSKGVSLIAATQTPEQLIEIYGKEKFKSLFATVGTRILGRVDGENKQFFSQLIGNRDVFIPTTSKTTSAYGNSETHGWQDKQEPVVHPSELGKLGDTGSGNRVLIDGFQDVAIVELPYFNLHNPHPDGIFDPNPSFNSIAAPTSVSLNSFSCSECASATSMPGGYPEPEHDGGRLELPHSLANTKALDECVSEESTDYQLHDDFSGPEIEVSPWPPDTIEHTAEEKLRESLQNVALAELTGIDTHIIEAGSQSLKFPKKLQGDSNEKFGVVTPSPRRRKARRDRVEGAGL